jgi:membrane associated rhomboid family serine protease
MVTLYFYTDYIRLIGASGDIYGMVSSGLCFISITIQIESIMMRIFRATGFALIMLFPEKYNPSTSYLAHASGFVIGIITGLLVIPFAKVRTV